VVTACVKLNISLFVYFICIYWSCRGIPWRSITMFWYSSYAGFLLAWTAHMFDRSSVSALSDKVDEGFGRSNLSSGQVPGPWHLGGNLLRPNWCSFICTLVEGLDLLRTQPTRGSLYNLKTQSRGWIMFHSSHWVAGQLTGWLVNIFLECQSV